MRTCKHDLTRLFFCIDTGHKIVARGRSPYRVFQDEWSCHNLGSSKTWEARISLHLLQPAKGEECHSYKRRFFLIGLFHALPTSTSIITEQILQGKTDAMEEPPGYRRTMVKNPLT